MLKINRAPLGGSLILLITFNVYNAINFVFQFSMARMLTIADYGVLAALFSISYVFGVFIESIQTIMMKYSASEKDKGKLKNLLKKSLKLGFNWSVILFIVYLIISIPLSYMLNISYILVAISGLFIFSSLLLPVNRGIMLGQKRFKSLGLNLLLESFSKLVLGIFLVFIGFNVYGAVFATLFGVALAFLFSLTSLRDIFKSDEKKAYTENIYRYTVPVFFVTLIITLFFSIDTLIAKMVFNEELAGHYALASILAKTIFWGTLPISKAMFPMSVNNLSSNKSNNSRNLLFNAILILTVIIGVVLTLFYFFPEQIIKIFSGKSSSEASGILFYLGITMGCLSFANLALLYKLSKGKTKGYAYSIIFIIIEAIMLLYFSSSITKFSIAFIASSVMFLIGSIFVLREQNEGFNNNSSI